MVERTYLGQVYTLPGKEVKRKKIKKERKNGKKVTVFASLRFVGINIVW